MIKIAVLFADGTEEIEALTPVDVLKRAGVECEIVSVSGKNPTGSHNIKILPDRVIENVDLAGYDGVVIPGGMPGAVNIANSKKVVDGIKNIKKTGKLIAAICASPAVVLAAGGVIDGEKLTCYPAERFVEEIKKHGEYLPEEVVECGNIITANGPKSAMAFSLKICRYLGVTPKF